MLFFYRLITGVVSTQQPEKCDGKKIRDVAIFYEQQNIRPKSELRQLRVLVQQLHESKVKNGDSCIRLSLFVAWKEPLIVMPLDCDEKCFVKAQLALDGMLEVARSQRK